ncbi:MAG: hypothetical protein ACR2QE_08215 [Acidimicrobiales bacterium]
MGKVESELVPAARRTRFARWPRRGLSEHTRQVGLEGIAAAREELERHGCEGDGRGGAARGLSRRSRKSRRTQP